MNLGSICVKGRSKITFKDFQQVIRLALVEHCKVRDSVEAEVWEVHNERVLIKQFSKMSMVIEYAPNQFNFEIKNFLNKQIPARYETR